MNIFVTSTDPIQAAINLDDKRVKHMPKECIEMLGIYVHSVLDIWVIPFPLWGDDERTDTQFLYNHPCSRWVRKDKANMTWLFKHTVALFDEHEYRFGVVNPVQHFLLPLRDKLQFVDREPTNFQNSSLFKDLPVVDAYRETMKVKWFHTDKIKPVRWSKRTMPIWCQSQTELEL